MNNNVLDSGNALDANTMAVFTATLNGFSSSFGKELNSVAIGTERVCFKKLGDYSILLHCDARVGETAAFGMLKEISNLLEVISFMMMHYMHYSRFLIIVFIRTYRVLGRRYV